MRVYFEQEPESNEQNRQMTWLFKDLPFVELCNSEKVLESRNITFSNYMAFSATIGSDG